MNNNLKHFILMLLICSIFAGFNTVQAKTDNIKTDEIITFNDKNLEDALCSAFNCKKPITKKMAHKLSKEDGYIYLWDKDISDLEGIQYFDELYGIDLSNNNLRNLQPLSKLPDLIFLDISSNSIKGKELENLLNKMGKIENLDTFKCYNNEIEDITFLQNIGNMSKYDDLNLSYNHINDISILRKSNNLKYLDLVNNRIQDFTPINNLKYEYPNIYLYDNCMIDFKPIKTLFDRMFTGRCGGDLTSRFDFYKNSVNIIYQNQEINFPHMTVYYMFQAYAEAIPLIEALGGSAKYDAHTGTLTCNIYDKELIMYDFSTLYTLNGVNKIIPYEMRRMQYNTAYVPVKDFCNILGLNYNVLKQRNLYNGDSETPELAPEVVEISDFEATIRTAEFKYKIIDNQVGITKYLGTENNVTVPSQIDGLPITYIEDGAFCDDLNLVTIDLPNTITRIGTSWNEEGVFAGCVNLVSVKFEEGTAHASIGSNAFLGCNSLTDITIPGNYKVIHENAFNNCINLKTVTISEGVEQIEAGAFAGDEALVSVTLPSTITALGYQYDEDITTDPYYLNQTGVFSFCKHLKKVNILEGTTDAYIGANTFSDCTKLESILIPGNYKAIYHNAFYNCVRLKSFIYEKSKLYSDAYQIIDKNVFEGCKRLEKVLLSESLRNIGNNAFIDCSNVKDIIIPDGVVEIGSHAFSGTSLESVTIPSTVISIGVSVIDETEASGGTFAGCENLVNVLIKEGNKKAIIGESSFYGCTRLTKIVIPGNYTTIGEEAFSGCISLKSVVYKANRNPSTKQKILTYAFHGCKNLVAVELPSTLTLMEFEAFGSCTKLKSVVIPTGVNKLYLKEFVFNDCASLSKVYVGENIKLDEYALSSTSYSKVNVYTNSKDLKKLEVSEEFTVYSPKADYVNGSTLFGSVDIISTFEVGSILTANLDAVVPINATVSYKWMIDGITVSTESTYQVKNNLKGKTIKLIITGIKGYKGSLSKTVNTEKIYNVRYDGYYYNYEESDKTLDIFKFFPDGKVINAVIELDDITKLKDNKKRAKYFSALKKWFNYYYEGGFGNIEVNNNNIYFEITFYDNENDDLNGEVEQVGMIQKNSLALVVISHRTDYRGYLIYSFIKE